jgi:nucleoside-diphosphate-sugar epimerase
MSDRELHVVFGAGQIGSLVARQLASRGHEVRIVRRSAAPPIDGITMTNGDAGDAAFATEVTRGAAAIYHCVNPAYSAKVWAIELPRVMESLSAAGARNGSKLVVLDNLYALGRPQGAMNEDAPMSPASRKGEVRARVAAQLFEAHAGGKVRAVMGRASDFYGPGGTQSYYGDYFWPRVLAGRSAQFLANPDTPHTWHFTRDVAAALVTLGEAPDDAYGRWWMLPCAPPRSSREMVRGLATALGREIRTERVPALVIRTMGVFMPLMRELAEMTYQWETPFVCDDARFRTRFGSAPTAIDEGTRETVTWATEHYAAKSTA